MIEVDEDPASRASKYVKALKSALEDTKFKADDTTVSVVRIHEVADAIQRYLQDAEHYLTEKRSSTSLAAVAYAEGLLDALIFLGLTAKNISE